MKPHSNSLRCLAPAAVAALTLAIPAADRVAGPQRAAEHLSAVQRADTLVRAVAEAARQLCGKPAGAPAPTLGPQAVCAATPVVASVPPIPTRARSAGGAWSAQVAALPHATDLPPPRA